EVQIKYGTNEQSARQNPPFFIKINEEIDWVEPEAEEMVKINGVPHKLDKHGNVNINLTTPAPEPAPESKVIQAEPFAFKDELDMQLTGLRNEYELKNEGMKQDMHNKLIEQNIKFKEMLLSERENRLNEREHSLALAEQSMDEKQREIQDDVKGYLKVIPNALGGMVKDWIKHSAKNPEKGLGSTDNPEEKPRKRSKVKFSIESEPQHNQDDLDQEIEEEIAKYEEQEHVPNVVDEVLPDMSSVDLSEEEPLTEQEPPPEFGPTPNVEEHNDNFQYEEPNTNEE
ncbi:MAG: hypothetical protein JKX76_04025, partial [Colwellia sp.]|nr:hypothetical protein [Colwellia sp.]